MKSVKCRKHCSDCPLDYETDKQNNSLANRMTELLYCVASHSKQLKSSPRPWDSRKQVKHSFEAG